MPLDFAIDVFGGNNKTCKMKGNTIIYECCYFFCLLIYLSKLYAWKYL